MEFVKEIAENVKSKAIRKEYVHACIGTVSFIVLGAIYFRDLIA